MIPRPSYITKIGTQSFGRACRSSRRPSGGSQIDLVYYHEKSVDEVAQVVGIPASTVKTTHVRRAKAHGEAPGGRRTRWSLIVHL